MRCAIFGKALVRARRFSSNPLTKNGLWMERPAMTAERLKPELSTAGNIRWAAGNGRVQPNSRIPDRAAQTSGAAREPLECWGPSQNEVATKSV